MAIENIPSSVRAQYADLFEMVDHRIEESQNLEIEEIILEICNKDAKIQLERKVASVNSRALNQMAQAEASNEKANLFRQVKGTYLEGAAVICHLVAVGSNPIFTQIGQAFSATNNQYDKIIKSQEEVLGYDYQRMRDTLSDYTQEMQSAEKEHEQDTNAIERMIQNSRRQAELIAGN
jgi:hypothetical protein